jgi:hypothetical protein
MNINIKNLGIFFILLTIISILLYVFAIYFDINLQEGLDTNTNSKTPVQTTTETKKPGVYVMTNTTYDSNGNVVVKTMDTSGNFSVNTYGSTTINSTGSTPPPTSTTTTQQPSQQSPHSQAQIESQTQFIPSTTSEPSITVEDINKFLTVAKAVATTK